MNKQLHRLVFNRRLGLYVPVAEVVRAGGKAASGSSRRGRSAPARLATAALAASALVVASLAAPQAQAQTPPPASRARPAVVFGSALAAPSQALPQKYGSTRRADGSFVNDPTRRSWLANPAHAGQVTWQVNGPTATLDQGNVDRVILNWDSFDIAAGHSVEFKQNPDPAKYVSALNRIWSADPSLILGTLKANREVLLLNPNGVYFGRGARVDTGKFIASALSIADSVFERGLRNVTDGIAVFSADGTDHLPTALTDSDTARSAAISVEAGAQIRSAAGGDVLLVAPRVLNAGSISTPQGQTVLAAGSRVYLMSSSDPAQRGLIVAVDAIREAGSQAVDTTLGSVENRAGASGGPTTPATTDATTGLVQQIDAIRAERGNVNLVGLSVRQHGQINATTAVKGANGSIVLQAMAGTTPVVGGSTGTARGFGLNLEPGATARVGNGGGTVELGSGSRTTVTPETNGATQIDAEQFNRSRIQVTGGAIAVAGGAQIIAPSGQVDLVATQSALLSPLSNSLANTAQAQADASRIVIAPGALISVAGLQGVAVDGARHQGQQRLFRIELADMPVQRSGPLYRSELFFDLRQAAQVAVADVSGAAAALPRTAQELSTAGGSLRIEAEGAVVIGAGAQLDVSGGSVQVSATTLQQSQLSSGGRSLAFSQASAGLGLDSLGSTRRTLQPAYTEGRAGGTLQIGARQLALAGALRGNVVQGERQVAGTDATAAPAVLGIGRLFGVNNFHYLPALELLPSQAPSPASAALASLWADPLQATLDSLPPVASLSLQGLGGERGFGVLQLSAQTLSQPVFGTLNLGPGGALTINAETLALDGAFSTPGGSIRLATTRAEAAQGDSPGSGDIRLSARTALDTAGRWTNLLGTSAAASDGLAALDGGEVQIVAARSLLIEAGAVLDVSGGARLGNTGRLSTGDAGRLSLAIGRSALIPSGLQLAGVSLRGFDFSDGGTLDLGTPGFTLGPVADTPDSGFQLPAGVLSGAQGFGDIRISAHGDLRLASGTLLAPVLHNWALVAGHALAASGSLSAAVVQSAVLDDQLAERAPVHLSLAAALPLQPALGQAGASLVVERGATLTLAPGARLTLEATRNLAVGTEGGQAGQVATLQAPGGAITLRTTGLRGADSLGEASADPAGFLPDQALWLGAEARLLAAGTAVLRPEPLADRPVALRPGPAAAGSPARTTGAVLGGGSVTLDAQRGYLVAQAGSVIQLDGAQAVLNLPGQVAPVNVARPAGSLVLRSAEGMALEGTVSATAPRDATGQALADGGRLTVALGVGGVATFTQGNLYPGSRVDNLQGAPIAGAVAKPREIQIGEPTQRAGGTVATGTSVNWFQSLDSGIAWLGTPLLTESGFDALRLGAGDRIHFAASLNSFQPLGIVLDAPALSAAPGVAVALGGAQVALGDHTEPRLRKGAAPDLSARADDPALATTTLNVRAPTVTGVGDSALQGFNSVALAASGDIRLSAVNPAQGAASGSLAFASDLLLQAAQVYSTTGSAFNVNGLPATSDADPGSRLLLRRSDGAAALPAAPLSALGSFSASATTIDHDGVLRQPFGAISLVAERSLSLGPHSLSTVSGNGASLLVGSTDNLSHWTLANGLVATALPLAKGIRLQANNLATASTAVVNAQGGGDLLAWEFFAGVGGSQDALAADGVYAVLPNHAAAPALALNGGTLPDTDANGLAGRQLVITQTGSGLAPGAYTLLPARWALLHGLLPQGAFLVRRDNSGSSPQAAAERQDDGSTLVSAYVRDIGSVFASQPMARFEVAPAASFSARSEIRLSSVSDLLARQSASAGQTQALPKDGGQVQVLLSASAGTAAPAPAPSLWQAGLVLGAGNNGGRAGALDMGATTIALVDDLAKTPAGALGISAQALRTSQAGSVLLGGQRSSVAAGDDGLPAFSLSGALAQALHVDIGSSVLQLEELVLASAGSLHIAAGTQLQASASSTLGPRSLRAEGDGALAVLSANALQVQRSGATLVAGNLQVGAGVRFSGAQLVLDATGLLQLPPSVGLGADALTLSARRIEVGAAALPDAQATVLAGDLLATARRADALTLRSYTSIDFAGQQDWAARGASGRPGSVQRSLVLDAPALRGVAAAGDAAGSLAVHTDIAAQTVQLRNSSGRAAAVQAAGLGSLVLQALPALQVGGTGGLTLGPGATALGFDEVLLRSAGDIVLSGEGSTTAQHHFKLQAARLTAATAADQALVAATGALQIGTEPGSVSLGERVGQGAQVRLQAPSIVQAGHIDLPGALLSLQASGGGAVGASGPAEATAAPAILFAPGSLTSVAGYSVAGSNGTLAFGQPGSLVALADTGAVQVLGRLDASAAAGATPAWSGGDGGSLRLQASGSGGALSLAAAPGVVATGELLARAGSGAGDRGGSLQIDVASLPSADAAAQAALAGGITGQFDLRVRSGDVALASPVTAQRISLAADAGSLVLRGATLDARAPAGGVVTLAAGGPLVLSEGSRIDARSLRRGVNGGVNGSANGGANGGDVLLASREGRLSLGADSQIDAGGDSAADGRIVLRAARGADGRSVQIDPLRSGQLQAGDVALEAVQTYRQVTVAGVTRDITSIAAGNSAIAGSGNNRSGTLGQASVGSDSARLVAGADALLASLGVSADDRQSGRVRLAPGVEVQAAGDLTLSADWPLNDAARGGEAGFLSLRAAGNLVLNGSISDGFASAAPTAALQDKARAWSLRLAAGADLSAAAPLAVVVADPAGDAAPRGDLQLNAGRLLRTGAGSIELAAGRDLRLAAGSGNLAPAQVYVAGRPLADADTDGDGVGEVARLFATQAVKPQFTEQGGRLDLAAGRDIVAPEPTQLINNWLWRNGQPSTLASEDGLYAANSQLGWWPQFNRFRQTAASLGGGNLSASAGRDILNLQAFTPTQGWADSRVMAEAGLHTLGGGDLTVQAGRNLRGGQFLVGVGEGRLSAGAEIGALAANARLQAPLLAQMDSGRWLLQSRGPLAIVGSFNPTAAPVTPADSRAPQSGLHYTWGTDAGLWLRSLSGDVQLLGGLGANLLGGYGLQNTGGAENLLRVLPPTLHASALGGDLRLFAADAVGGVLFPAAGSGLSLWAAGDLRLGEGSSNSSLAQADTDLTLWPLFSRPLSQTAAAQLYTGAGSTILATLADTLPRQGLHAGQATPVQVVAGGSISQPAQGTGAFRLAQAAEFSAGEDILNLRLVGQHLGADDTSRISAGQDFLAGALGQVELVGPGRLLLSAGGNLDLGNSAGVSSTGNLRNARLPAQGAALQLSAAAAGTLDLQALATRWLQAGDAVNAARAAGYRALLQAEMQAQVASALALDFDTAWALFSAAPPAVQAAFGQRVLAAEFGHRYLGDTVAATDTLASELLANFTRHQTNLLAAGEAALAADQALTLPGRETLKGDALRTRLDQIRAVGFEQLDTQDTVLARQKSLAALRDGWRDAVARQLGSTPQALAALPADHPQAQAYANGLASRSGPLFEAYRLHTLAAETVATGTLTGDYGPAALPLRMALYDQGFRAAELAGQGSFVPQPVWQGDSALLARSGELQLTQSAVITQRGGDIGLINPGGATNVGLKQSADDGRPRGVIALRGGTVLAYTRDDFQVNTQRVQVIGAGDILIWSSLGDIDSGRGANTAVAAPALAARRGIDGMLFETPAGTSGSGIAVLRDAVGQGGGTVGLFTPLGEILALDAFIRADSVIVPGPIQGADNAPGSRPAATPPAVPPPAVAPASADNRSTAAASANATQADNRPRSSLLTVDLLGLGEAPTQPDCSAEDEKAGKCKRPGNPAAANQAPAVQPR